MSAEQREEKREITPPVVKSALRRGNRSTGFPSFFVRRKIANDFRPVGPERVQPVDARCSEKNVTCVFIKKKREREREKGEE